MGRKNSAKDEGVSSSIVTTAETSGGAATNEAAETTQQTADESLTEKLTPYFEAYPNEKLFHITSDGQVFLEKSYNDAVNHQRLYDHTKKVLSFERE